MNPITEKTVRDIARTITDVSNIKGPTAKDFPHVDDMSPEVRKFLHDLGEARERRDDPPVPMDEDDFEYPSVDDTDYPTEDSLEEWDDDDDDDDLKPELPYEVYDFIRSAVSYWSKWVDANDGGYRREQIRREGELLLNHYSSAPDYAKD